MILLIIIAGFLGWWLGLEMGCRMGNAQTDYWFEDAQRWMKIALDHDDEPDGGISRRPKVEPKPKSVKAIAKAASASR